MNYLASPPLVVAYAIAGTIDIDLTNDPIGHDPDGKPVYLRDIWPTNKEIGDMIAATVGPELFAQNYADVFKGDSRRNDIQSPDTLAYQWDEASTYIKNSSEEHTSELQSLMRISYAVFCLKQKKT